MGAPKISKDHERAVVRLLSSWRLAEPFGWEKLRVAIGENPELGHRWTRQALSGNKRISSAYDRAKKRISSRNKPDCPVAEDELQSRIVELEKQIRALEASYEKLATRHRVLMSSASKLRGGVRLLAESLPTNTLSQQKESKRSREARAKRDTFNHGHR